MLRKYLLSWISCIVCFGASSQAFLNDQAIVSLLTTTPCDNAVYTLYGHTSIRIKDSIAPGQIFDYVFNYGQFDASKPNFVYHFAKGELDYILAFYKYEDFASDRQLMNSSVYEQVLNLTQTEKEELLMTLLMKAQPENRNYRYNFFFDNCATRPAQLIEQIINGQIVYQENPAEGKTFRDIINDCTRNSPWQTFGCDLVLGIPTDRTVTLYESFFIPEFLQKAYSDAQIINLNGTKRPLVLATYLLIEEIPDEETGNFFLTPWISSLLLLVIVFGSTLIEWRSKKYFRLVDCLLFFMAGIAGCILFFLCFLSEHPSIWPNISIVWLHPFQLIGVVLFAVKKLHKVAYFYHFINFAALLLMSLAWIFIPQHLNIAFIPLIAALLLRSGYCLVRQKMNIR